MYPPGQYPPVPGYAYYPPMPMPNIPMPNAMINAYNQRFPHAPYMWYPPGPPKFMAPPPLHQVPSSSQASRFSQMYQAPAVQRPKASQPEKMVVERSLEGTKRLERTHAWRCPHDPTHHAEASNLPNFLAKFHPVWEYFELWKEPAESYSETTADCKLCGRRFPRASTVTAKGHLSGKHRPEFLKVCEAAPGHRHHYGPFGRPRAVPTTVEMKGQGSRTENAMLQSTSVFHPAMDEYKIQEYVNSAPINAQQFEANNLPAINSKPFQHVNLPGVSIRPFEPANFNMRPCLFNEPPPAGHRAFEPTILPTADIKLLEPTNYLPVNIKPLDPTSPLPSDTKRFQLFKPANPAPIDTKHCARPDLLCNDKKLLAHNLPPIDTKSFGESKPRSSVQMSPISMDSPASPRFFKIEAKLEAEETEQKTETKMEDEETENLLKMFKKRHDGLYECNLCTFCSSYDLNAFRAHQDTTHRVQRYKPNPRPQNEGLMPGFASSL
ncbi:unnamed protein product, partial [Mesorhabditis spiculigera]